jgi:Domain of unknown function (DUF4158)
MSGRLLDAFRVIPSVLCRHLSTELGIDAPELASLRAMYGRGRTLFDHQQVACESLGFRWMSEHQRRALVRELRDEVARCADREQLLVRARQTPKEKKEETETTTIRRVTFFREATRSLIKLSLRGPDALEM